MLSEGNKLYSVSGADNLGTSASSTGANVQVDNTGPSLTTVIAATTGTSPQGFVKQGGTYRVYANATDLPSGSGNSSGVNAATLTANVSTVSAGQTAVALTACGACGPSSAYAYQSAQLTADAVLSEGNKLYSVSGADNLGTSASSSGANVQVDNTAPTVAAVIANTTTNEPGWLAQGSGYRVYANVTELPSGSGASSGVNASSITANVSNVTTGQTAVALTTSGCPCTIGGTTYAYRSAALTSNNPLSAGSKSFTASAGDNLGIEHDPERQRDDRQHCADALDAPDVRRRRRRQGRSGQGDLQRDPRDRTRRRRRSGRSRTRPAAHRTRLRAWPWPPPLRRSR